MIKNKKMWESCISSQKLLQKNVMNQLLIDSWNYCFQNKVNPYSDQATEQVSLEQLLKIKQREDIFLAVVAREVNWFKELIPVNQALFTLANSEGVIIWSEGDEDIQRIADEINFSEGSVWTENIVGTNAIGLTLRTKKSVKVETFEHFSSVSHPFSCLSVPLLDREKEIIGCLNISTTGYFTDYHSLESTMKLLAKSIEKELLTHSTYQKMKILYPYLPFSDETMVLCDEEEMIVSLTGDFQALKAEWLDRPVSAFLKNEARTFQKSPIITKGAIIGYRYIFSQASKQLAPTNIGLLSQNKKYQAYIRQLKISATSSLPVYIYGETGSGKEIAAKNIHQLSQWNNGPLVALNCGAIQPDLLESELFGYVDGAFTGARNSGHQGKLAQANGGTLFLDEIDSMPKNMQVALLRVLEEKIVTPLGSEHGLTTDFRLITASNRELKTITAQGEFRQDLFYRVYGLPLHIPPLRERPEDFSLLIEQFAKIKNWQPTWLIELAEDLGDYKWQGNIREFNYFLERLFLFYPINRPTKTELDALVELGALPLTNNSVTLSEAEQIQQALIETQGNMTKAAERLNISRSTLYRKCEKLQIPN